MRYFHLEANTVDTVGDGNSAPTFRKETVISSFYKTELTIDEIYEKFQVRGTEGWAIDIFQYSTDYAEITFDLLFDSPEIVISMADDFDEIDEEDLPQHIVKSKGLFVIFRDIDEDLEIPSLTEIINAKFPGSNIITHRWRYEKGASGSATDLLLNLGDLLNTLGSLYGGIQAIRDIYNKLKTLFKENEISIDVKDKNVKEMLETHLLHKFGVKPSQVGCFLSSENLLVCEFFDYETEIKYVIFYNLVEKKIVESVIVSS